METILSYLNNMFANLPSTPEVRRAREELQQMMEDKYHELRNNGKSDNEAVGQVIAEFGNLEELGDQLGIGSQVSASMDPQNQIAMSAAEVEAYLKASEKSARKISQGVLLCIIASIPLLLLTGFRDQIGLAENLAAAIGIGVLFVSIAIAVYQFIVHGMATEKYEELEKAPVSIADSVRHEIQERKEANRLPMARRIGLGVVMILVGVALVAVLGALEVKEAYRILSVCVLLLLVGFAVKGFVRSAMESEAFDKLLNVGDYTPAKRKGNLIMDRLGGAYWMLVVVGYLAWSFTTFRWNFTWIVWPIAGVLYGLISAILGAFQKEG